MFTGIVSDVGEIIEMKRLGERYRLAVASAFDPSSIAIGASIANAGVCLTVVGVEARNPGARIAFDVGAETLAVTTLGAWREGDRVNLERSLRVGDELGGHMVSGHVDGVAEILSRRDFNGMAHFRFRALKDCARFIAVKGSVALDGASLTVNAVDGDAFEVLLIPHTLAVTTWGERRSGDRVNIEVDQMARYAARLIEAGRGDA
ncbi:MAG: riboflavin synthase [Hyphomicrobiales bacterium]|nr:riboflavin synthase [Hyphomicrobiales bacterium]MBV8320033.1 riboflavin synthase [Hyphomicrobiales bacterium]